MKSEKKFKQGDAGPTFNPFVTSPGDLRNLMLRSHEAF